MPSFVGSAAQSWGVSPNWWPHSEKEVDLVAAVWWWWRAGMSVVIKENWIRQVGQSVGRSLRSE